MAARNFLVKPQQKYMKNSNRAFSAAGKYRKSKIKRILIDLYNTDRDIKRGNIDKDTALELTALNACP